MRRRTLHIRRQADGRPCERRVGLVRCASGDRRAWLLMKDLRVAFVRERSRWAVEVCDGLVTPPSDWCVIPDPEGRSRLLPGRHRTLSAAVLAALRWGIVHPAGPMAGLIDRAPVVRELLLGAHDDEGAALEMLHDRLSDLGVADEDRGRVTGRLGLPSGAGAGG
jgi:hypothetical protein